MTNEASYISVMHQFNMIFYIINQDHRPRLIFCQPCKKHCLLSSTDFQSNLLLINRQVLRIPKMEEDFWEITVRDTIMVYTCCFLTKNYIWRVIYFVFVLRFFFVVYLFFPPFFSIVFFFAFYLIFLSFHDFNYVCSVFKIRREKI